MHPWKRNLHTSLPALDCNRLLITSAGAHSVVAIVPAAKEEMAWVVTSSAMPRETVRYCLAVE
jgi:hypothetical protein